MNYWARMLRDLPAIGQRLIARTQRISLPREANAEERHTRLRQALCHAATVRATYLSLDPDAQAALQDLRTRRGGIRPDELERRYGTVRSWRQLAADPRPRTIAERLILLGWLLFRPATARHPAHYLLPPELRRWLPKPLVLRSFGLAPLPPPPLALRATATLLLACAERPLAVRANGMLRRSSLRALARRLPPLDDDETARIASFLLPLLQTMGLVADQRGTCALTPVGQRFLDLPPAEQLARLRQAWISAPLPDAWLTALLIDPVGIDWPLLRRRLCAWAEALPVGVQLDPQALYGALADTFGPLADAHTHGFRRVDRVPWQPRRAAAVFQAALRGPLHWLGFVAWPSPTFVARCPPPTATRSAMMATAWRYGVPGEIVIPHAGVDADVVRLVLFARWHAADDATTTYRISGATIAQARGQGWSDTILWELLERRAGPIPAAWRAGLADPPAPVRIVHAALAIADQPAVLDRALRAGSIKRRVATRLAPGIALVHPEQAGPLARLLQRRQIAVITSAPPASPPPDGFTASECAALLVACAFYRAHAPPGAPLLPHALLEQRLRGALPRRLQAATAQVLAELEALARPQRDSALASEGSAPAPPGQLSARADLLPALQRAIATRRMVEMTYYTAERRTWTRRAVRPLTVEQRGDAWYLEAYCAARREERMFRLDRIGSISVL
jgi:hypothetical protein